MKQPNMHIIGLRLDTNYPQTIMELKSGASFRLADPYIDPDSARREGVVVNATTNANIGVGRQRLAINKPINDHSATTLTVAILTDQKFVEGKLTFNQASQEQTPGQASIAIGKSKTEQAMFTTTDPNEAEFSLIIDESWGRPQNDLE